MPVRGAGMVAEHALMQILVLAKHTRALMDVVQGADDYGRPRDGSTRTISHTTGRITGG